MKVTIIEPIPVPQPPRKVLIELTEEQAQILHVVAGGASSISVVRHLQNLPSLYGRRIKFNEDAARKFLGELYEATKVVK